MDKGRRYLISTEGDRQKKTIWDTNKPMMLGSRPSNWVIETSAAGKGFRIRNLMSPFNEVQSGLVREFDFPETGEDCILALPNEAGGDSKLVLKVSPLNKVSPVYRNNNINLAEDFYGDVQDQTAVQIFHCRKSCILGTQRVDESFTAGDENLPIFKIKKTPTGWGVLPLRENINIKLYENNKTVTLNKDEILDMEGPSILGTQISFGAESWIIRPDYKNPELDYIKTIETDSMVLKKSMQVSMVLLGLFLMLVVFYQKPEIEKEEVIMPAQYAKVLLKSQSTPDEMESAESPTAKSAHQKAVNQKKAVVKAFKTKVLQRTIKGLLAGGLTKYMAQVDLVNAKKTLKDTNQLMSKTDATALDQKMDKNLLDQKDVQVSKIGGGSLAKGVGYAKGKAAKVKGQGSAFVSLELDKLNVQNGLTKDQVGKVIHEHLSEIRYCYESSMIRNPDVEGKLIVDFAIGGAGRVSRASVVQSTLADPRLDDCVLRRLRRWLFPKPVGGVTVDVKYPFIFKSLGS